MKNIILIAMMFLLSIVFTGCGGGGGSSGTKAAGSTSTTLTTTTNQTIPITQNTSLSVSRNIIKTYYLPSFNLTEPLSYTLLSSATQGEVKMLDATTGRVSYLSSATSQNDIFTYSIRDATNNTLGVEVNVSIENVDVTLNAVVENNFSSNLPLVIIDTGDKEIPDEPKIKGTMAIIEPDSSTGRSSLDLTPQYRGYMEIEIRGSSSQIYPKKQYSVDTETWDQEDDDVALLGMPKEYKWILQAPYADKSLMRNYLAYTKTRQIDETQYYAVRTHFVELLIRKGDTYSYNGVYVLMEKIKRDKNRLNIEKLSSDENLPPEITGGYIIKQDSTPDPDEDMFLGITGTEFIYVYPKSSKITIDQKYYIENYVQQFEFALYASDFNDSTSSNYYPNYISVEDFIVHFLSREFFMDVDTWLKSEYLHKDINNTLALSTVWDFNAGMGNNNFRLEGRSDGWTYDLIKNDYPETALRKWMERLMSDPTFRLQVRAKWSALRNSIWSDANLTQFINDTQILLTESAQRNFEKWPEVLGQYVWPNRKACDDAGTPVYCSTFNRAVNEHLKIWILNRAQWIDSNLSI